MLIHQQIFFFGVRIKGDTTIDALNNNKITLKVLKIVQIFSDLRFDTPLTIKFDINNLCLLSTETNKKVKDLFCFLGVINKIWLKIAKSFPEKPKKYQNYLIYKKSYTLQ